MAQTAAKWRTARRDEWTSAAASRHPPCRIGGVAVQPGSRSENMGDRGIRRVL
ncbi:hypothetical protein [Agromyces mariniharenae]|uniref:hypothetical protein n=1 Tax=Agromyces mariniharenae TaxID=2604423 RepID=UPI0016533DEF|nr:hypothetical protein [Agromyces mariniharenae]